MTKQPAWLTQLQHDLNAPIMVPDGWAIDWDRCRDLFLISLLRRLEKRSNSPYPAIVRGLLQRRLTGEAVMAELSAATAWATAWVATTATATWPGAVWVEAVADDAARDAWASAVTWADSKKAERLAQASDLREAIAASIHLTINADELIKVKAVIYPTEEQFVALGGAIEEFKQLTPVRSCVELVYCENEGKHELFSSPEPMAPTDEACMG